MIDANYFKSSKAVLCRVDLELKVKALAGANHENCGVNCRCIRFLSNDVNQKKIVGLCWMHSATKCFII